VDWVYPEELSVRSNYFWSPDGKSIVFLHMDETRVPTYPNTDWMPTHPTVDMEQYPQAGKQFRFMVYPNKTHSIRGADDRDQLFHMIEDHFERELK
jgi:Dipeptidyl peptidase IV (DPP IV) N-terminal region